MENIPFFGKLFIGAGVVMIFASMIIIVVVLFKSITRLGRKGRELFDSRFYGVDWKISVPRESSDGSAIEGIEGRRIPLCPACGDDLIINEHNRPPELPAGYFKPFTWHCKKCDSFTGFPEGFRGEAADNNADILESVLMNLRVAMSDGRVRKSAGRLTVKE